MALGKFKLALKDFEAVKRAKPRDPDALSKYNACNKIVTQQAFERAIEVESSKKNIAESIDLSTMGKSLEIIFIMIFFGGHQFKSKLNCPVVEATCIFHPVNVFLTIYAEKFCKLIFLRIVFHQNKVQPVLSQIRVILFSDSYLISIPFSGTVYILTSTQRTLYSCG